MSGTKHLQSEALDSFQPSRAKIRFGAGLALVLFIFLGYAMINFRRVSAEHSADDFLEMQQTVQLLDLSTTGFFKKFYLLLSGLALSPVVQEKNTDKANALFRALNHKLPEVVNVAALDRNGFFFASGAPFDRDHPPSLKSAPFFSAIEKGAKNIIMDPHLGPLSKKVVTGMLLPIPAEDGSFGGVIGVSIQFDFLLGIWREILSGAPQPVILLDRRQRISLASGPFAPWTGSPLTDHGDLALLATEPLPEQTQINGILYRLYSKDIETSAWKIIAFSPLRPPFAEILIDHAGEILFPPVLLLMLSVCLMLYVRNRRSLRLIAHSEKRLHAIMDNTSSVIYLTDLEGKHLTVNRRFENLFGISKKEVAGKTTVDLFPDRTSAKLLTNTLRVAREASLQEFEEEILHSNGLHTYISVKFPLLTPQNTPYAICGISTDITERKKNEEYLRLALSESREAREKIDAILRGVPNGLMVTDPQLRVILMNTEAENLIPMTMDQVMGEEIQFVIPQQRFHPYIETLRLGTLPAPLDLELLDKKRAEVRIIQIRCSAIGNCLENPAGFIFSLMDVTRDREVDRMKSEFIAVAAHELSTPLACILGYADLLAHPEQWTRVDAAQQQEFLETIYEKGEKLALLVDEMIQLSRMETGRSLVLEKEVFDLKRMAGEVLVQYQRDCPEHFFALKAPEAGLKISADKNRMEQVLENLIANAAKYSPKGSKIEVGVSREGASCTLWVSDEGIGMTAEQSRRIFEKFYRADTSDTTVGGLGLGMCIVKNIVDAHKGFIKVETQLGQGTTIRVSLPA